VTHRLYILVAEHHPFPALPSKRQGARQGVGCENKILGVLAGNTGM
jgi:hypothetical protein